MRPWEEIAAVLRRLLLLDHALTLTLKTDQKAAPSQLDIGRGFSHAQRLITQSPCSGEMCRSF